jgi:hypothetical protein
VAGVQSQRVFITKEAKAKGLTMRYLLDFFALIGLVATIIVVGFYLGYATYQPKCPTVAAIFTKECK